MHLSINASTSAFGLHDSSYVLKLFVILLNLSLSKDSNLINKC